MLIAVSLSWVTVPWRSVNVPPASSTSSSHGGDVVGRHADGVDGDVEGALGDEAVLPEVAEARGPGGLPGPGRRGAGVSPRSSQPSFERDADLGVGERVDRRHPARPAVGERARRRATPTTAGPAPAPTRRRRRRRRRRGRGRSASPTPGCRGRSPTCRRSGRRSTATASRVAGRAELLAEQPVVRALGGEALGDRRLGGRGRAR